MKKVPMFETVFETGNARNSENAPKTSCEGSLMVTTPKPIRGRGRLVRKPAASGRHNHSHGHRKKHGVRRKGSSKAHLLSAYEPLSRHADRQVSHEPHNEPPWQGLYDMLPLDPTEVSRFEDYLLTKLDIIEAEDVDGANLVWRVAQIGDEQAMNALLRNGCSFLTARRDARYGIDAHKVAHLEGHESLANSLRAYTENAKNRVHHRPSEVTIFNHRHRVPVSAASAVRGFLKRVLRKIGYLRPKFERESGLSLSLGWNGPRSPSTR